MIWKEMKAKGLINRGGEDEREIELIEKEAERRKGGTNYSYVITGFN